MIEFSCQHCSKVLKTADDKAGLRAHCPGCGAEVLVPDAPAHLAVEGAPEPEPPGPDAPRKSCPMCGEMILTTAKVCRYCGEKLTGTGKGRKLLKPHRGPLILVLGLMSWLVCPFLGGVAWFMGTSDLKEMDAGQMDDEGRALTQAGRIIGLIFLILGILGMIIWVGVIILLVASGEFR